MLRDEIAELKNKIAELQQLDEIIEKIITIIESVMGIPFSEWGDGECDSPRSYEYCICREIFMWNIDKIDAKKIIPRRVITRHLRKSKSYRPNRYIKLYQTDYDTNFVTDNGIVFRQVADKVSKKIKQLEIGIGDE